MTRDIPPPPVPDHLPEEEQATQRARTRRRSRYDRPRTYISWFGLLLGLALGIAGGLYYAWNIGRVEEYDVAPRQLKQEHRDQYLVAVMLSYAYDGDLARTIERLNSLDLPGSDPIQAVADVACRLASTGYVSSSTGLRAVRMMMTFYRQQGRTGCADSIILIDDAQITRVPEVVILATPTPMPPASKTPTPLVTNQATATQIRPFVPTSPPSHAYDLVGLTAFCDADIPGLIEVRVRDYDGLETPSRLIRVRWNGGESRFYTGLKPERGLGYADFEMAPAVEYIVEMPGLSDPISEPVSASECFTEAGEESIISYRLVFQGE